MVVGYKKQSVVIAWSPIPNVDYFVSWRFHWAYNLLQTKKFSDSDSLMFNSTNQVDRLAGIGLCPLFCSFGDSIEEIQQNWKIECEQRLPQYGCCLSLSFLRYVGFVLCVYPLTFTLLVLGIWSNDIVEQYEIKSSLQAMGFKLDELLNGNDDDDDDGESRSQVSALISAQLSVRATLFLLVPYGSLISTYVSTTSAYPLIVPVELSKLLPGLLILNSFSLADKRVRSMGYYARWKVRLMSVYIFVTESRLINYLFYCMMYMISLLMVFHPVNDFLIWGAVIIVLHCFVTSLYIVILISNMFGVDDDVSEKSTRDASADYEIVGVSGTPTETGIEA
jgi:hypothetical protein